MKRLLLLLLLSGTVYSQGITHDKETVSKFLCKTWVVNYAMMNGLKVEKLGPMQSLKYAFKADGTYTMNDKNPGTWKFNAKKKVVELYVDGALKSTITSLQSKKAVMILTANPATPKGKIEIYFKPKA